MKARKKGTNDEWKDVKFAQLEGSGILYKEEYLEFDTLSTEIKTNEQIAEEAHWQDVRERAAIAAMQGMLANPELIMNGSSICYRLSVEFVAVDYADKLVEQLKKK